MKNDSLRKGLARFYPDAARRNSCRKVPHKSQGAAEAHVRAARKREETCERPAKLSVYRCSACHFWHVGHGR